MANFGVKLEDLSNNVLTLTPEMSSGVSTGQATMPDSLVATDNYYVSVDLPGTDPVDGSNLAAMVNAFLLNANYSLARLAVGAEGSEAYLITKYAEDAFTHYTRSWVTGVMTSWTPGPADADDRNKWDGIYTIFPVVFWRKLAATTFTDTKIFAAMCYDIFDGSAGARIQAYQVGTGGVSKVDYAILMKNRQVE